MLRKSMRPVYGTAEPLVLAKIPVVHEGEQETSGR
jgi:hypothetical protein